jgi:septum formation protein
MKTRWNVILASESPRRIEILRNLGIPFHTAPSSIEERWNSRTFPATIVKQLATQKAQSCQNGSSLIIAMDTLVVSGHHKLGKPENAKDAARMLRMLSGKMHRVYTGVAVLAGSKIATDFEMTKVFFRKLNNHEIGWYIKSGEPFGKAGAYAIQGFASVFIPRIEGCYFNVVGFPIDCFRRTLAKLKIDIFDLMAGNAPMR